MNHNGPQLTMTGTSRRLIADALILRGVRVIHLLDAATQREYVLSAEARRESAILIYDRHSTRRLDLQ